MPQPPSKAEALKDARAKNPLFKKHVVAGREWRMSAVEDMDPQERSEKAFQRAENKKQLKAAADKIRRGNQKVAAGRAFSSAARERRVMREKAMAREERRLIDREINGRKPVKTGMQAVRDSSFPRTPPSVANQAARYAGKTAVKGLSGVVGALAGEYLMPDRTEGRSGDLVAASGGNPAKAAALLRQEREKSRSNKRSGLALMGIRPKTKAPKVKK